MVGEKNAPWKYTGSFAVSRGAVLWCGEKKGEQAPVVCDIKPERNDMFFFHSCPTCSVRCAFLKGVFVFLNLEFVLWMKWYWFASRLSFSSSSDFCIDDNFCCFFSFVTWRKKRFYFSRKKVVGGKLRGICNSNDRDTFSIMQVAAEERKLILFYFLFPSFGFGECLFVCFSTRGYFTLPFVCVCVCFLCVRRLRLAFPVGRRRRKRKKKIFRMCER